MKQKQKYLLPLITPLLIGAAVQAGVITNYYDGFEGTGNGANLNTRPAPEGTLTANWFSRAAIKTTGSAVTITDGAGDNPSNASLGFTAEAGKIYALSADLNNISTASFDSVWLGFRDDRSGTAAFTTNNATAARVFRRADGDYTIRTEDGTGSLVETSGSGTMKLVLDTTESAWTITTYWNDELAGATYTYTENPDITHVGFGFSGGGVEEPTQFDNTVNNFSLTVIPEPSTLGLLTASSAGLLLLRRLLI